MKKKYGSENIKGAKIMKKIIRFVLLITLVFALHVTRYTLHVCYGAFEDVGVGARPMGMGSAFCGIADDVNAFLYNPSGLTQLDRLQVSAMYANLFSGLSDGSGISNNFLAMAYPSELGTLGFSWLNLSVNSDPERAGAAYSENTYILSYAKFIEFFSAGFSLRFHTKEYSESYWTSINPAFSQGRNAFGVGFDLSALYKTRDERLSIGMMISDINQPDIHLETSSPVPAGFRAGAAYKLMPVWSFEDITAAADMTIRDWDTKFHTGIEGWLENRSIGLRAGLEFGTSYFGDFSVGASYHLIDETYNNDFQFDYAFIYPVNGLRPTSGTHRISVTMGFGSF